MFRYLQDVFDVPLVIQLTDDEKFMFKEHLTLEECKRFAYDNAKDIIAFGFNPEKTFIFADSEYYGYPQVMLSQFAACGHIFTVDFCVVCMLTLLHRYMFDCILRVQKCLNFNQCSSVFGFDGTTSIGKLSYPCAEIATAFPGAFPHLFGSDNSIPSFIPCAIDQVTQSFDHAQREHSKSVRRRLSSMLGYLCIFVIS